MTIHRALGFVDRSALSDDSPLRVVMASEGRQADGIDLRMSGARLERYRGNPVLGYGHSYWGRMNLPIGRVDPDSIAVEGKQIVGRLEFDEDDEFARQVERKLRKKFLNAVSIGFDVTEWESENDNYYRGGVATGWELTELSVVPVPMDAAALVTSGRGLDLADPDLLAAVRSISEDEFSRLLVRLTALGNVAAGKPPFVEPIDDPDPEPPATGVPTDTARGLLDAFTFTKESHA
ncbi:HK97 family phage prohead protease [Actinoplanes sp. NPDC049118]|uniref:HK97 family phage prohead protease n=1 Tax=Actinoplanes sp. NPDC049118 TaxID=3155769 RepID=UPI0033F5473B